MKWNPVTEEKPDCGITVVARFFDGSIATVRRGVWDDKFMWEGVGIELDSIAFHQGQITHYADVPETPTEW